jgi:translation initiation factor IF-2
MRIRQSSGNINFAPRPNQTRLRDQQPGGGGGAAAQPKDTGVRKITGLSADQLSKGRNLTVDQVMQGPKAQSAVPGYVAPPDIADDDEKGGDKSKRPGAVQGRDQRRASRTDRAKKETSKGVQVQGGRVTVLDDDRPLRIRDRLKKRPHTRQPGTQPRKGNVQVTIPITVRVLSEAVGLAVPKLLKKLMEPPYDFAFGSVTINSVLDQDVAQLVAQDLGCELEFRKQQDAEEELQAKHQEADDPAHLKPRPPIVAIMGHVDHGKTSLLDKIRRSNVAAGEVGGITQVIRAWQVVHDGKPITFLDTPGHEAFTKMRARGAQVTDIAVIVCAADDGVMPQTEEAINHAKAAGVSIVIAINKIDLPNANLNKTRQQLYSLSILPDNMGGDTPFVETSAAKGTGINELLEAILVVAELKELKANPDKPGRGTCLEAHLSGDEGVQATLLIQDGTLRKGDILLCGPAQGRVRAMYNDLGHPIDEAGPGVPVRITGLDEVPDADDPFAVVDDITIAREIAQKRQQKRQDAAHNRFVPKTLETLGEIKVTELKVILKADFRGSVEAIKKELDKLTHEEVRVRLLHAGIGGITPSDVQLAMTSPTDTMIIGFNAVPDDEARALAEQLGVPIREYNIIYNLTDDIRAALEGKLKPREEIVYLGRAVVREVFKISKVGTVAGCHVTNGVIERSAKVRVIRGGVVIYPPADRTAGLESLKHHKDDVREIKQGYDCGIKIANYDDVKVDDVIEAYRVDEIKRTL